MDPAERARLVTLLDRLHGGLVVALIVMRPLVWDGDPASPANLVYLAIILLALFILGCELLGGMRLLVRWSWLGLAFAGLVVAVIPAALGAPRPTEGAAWWWQLAFHAGLGFYLLQVVPERLRIAWAALVTGVVGEIAISWIQGIYVLPAMAEAARANDLAVAAEGVTAGDLNERIARGGWFGTFTLSNTLAAWLLVAAVPLLGVVREATAGWRWLAGSLLVAVAGVFLATRSKGALAALALVGGLWWLLYQRGWRRWLPVPVALVGAVALLLLPALQAELEASGRVRLGYWQGALALVAERPLTGHGWGAFSERAGSVMPLWAEPSRLVHNEPLEMAVIAGIPLALALSGLLVWMAWPRWRTPTLPEPGPLPHFSAAIGLAAIIAYGCLLGMLDGNLGWWPGGQTLAGKAAWGLVVGVVLAAFLSLAARLPLPHPRWLRLGLAALALHCLVDFNLHSFAVIGTLLTIACLAGAPCRHWLQPRLAGSLVLALTVGLAVGGVRWAAQAGDLRATEDLVRSLRLSCNPAHREEGLSALADSLGVELPTAGDLRARSSLILAGLDLAWERAQPDPELALNVLDLAPSSSQRLQRLDLLFSRMPWSTGVARLRSNELAAAGRWEDAVAEAERAVRLSPAHLPTRQLLSALLERASRGLTAQAEAFRARREKVESELVALEPVVNYRNRGLAP